MAGGWWHEDGIGISFVAEERSRDWWSGLNCRVMEYTYFVLSCCLALCNDLCECE